MEIDEIVPHDNADRLEIAVVGGFNCIVLKDTWEKGDLAAYIAEQSVVPEHLIREIGLWDDERGKGRLAGKRGDRVKIIRLRGIYSQGLLYDVGSSWNKGENAAEFLGIEKYIPPIPPQFQGELGSTGVPGFNFDVENWKKYPDLIGEGDPVVITEKIHGTFQVIGVLPPEMQDPEMIDGKFFTTSKGFIGRGIWLKDTPANAKNTYIRVAKEFDLGPKLAEMTGELAYPFWMLGETYGVQKGYKYDATSDKPGFRAFAMRGKDGWLPHDLFISHCKKMGVETVPVLYQGPFSVEILKELTDGPTNLGGDHIREGVVVLRTMRQPDGWYRRNSRVLLKSVSEKYLMKATGDEIN